MTRLPVPTLPPLPPPVYPCRRGPDKRRTGAGAGPGGPTVTMTQAGLTAAKKSLTQRRKDAKKRRGGQRPQLLPYTLLCLLLCVLASLREALLPLPARRLP